MTIGELVYLIRADGSKLSSDLNSSEKDVKGWGQKISSWTVAKGQMIAKFAEKALASVANISKQVMRSTIEAYSTFEQLEGGTKLLFGNNDRTLQQYLKDVGITEKSTKKQIDSATASFEKNSRAQDFIFAKAADAYKNVQMSQNDYLTTANAFATGLKTSLGGDSEAAAQLADDIITAQADVVAATGASQESVANAFAGIMKGNYTMLDNLQLGITPTKKGMQDLINQVNKWNKANGKATKYNIKNLADQQKALVDYIKMQGLAGYAGKEAANTIQGTMAMTKAAWLNLLIAFGSGKDVRAATKNLAESMKQLVKNIFPIFKSALAGIKDFVLEIIPEIKAGFQNLIKKFKESDSPVLRGIGAALEAIENACIWISENQETVVNAIEAIIGAFAITKLITILATINPITFKLGLIASIAALIVANWSSIEKFFTDLWTAVKTAVDDAWDSVTQWWTGVKESISQTWSAIAKWFDDTVWKPLTEYFTAAWGVIETLWKGVKEAISKAWATIAEWFDTTVWQPLVQLFSPVIEAISGLWTNVKESISQTWAGISKWFNDTVWQPIITAFQPVIDLVKQLWDGISGKVEEAWNSVKDTLAPILEPIQKAFEDISSWVQQAIEDIKEFLGLNDEVKPPQLTEGQRQNNTEGLINAAVESGFAKNPDTAQWKNATANLRKDMEAAGFSAEQIEASITAISNHADDPVWITKFVSQLTDADAAAEAVSTALAEIDGTHVGATIDITVNDPSGGLNLGGGPGKGKFAYHKDRRTGEPISFKKFGSNAKGLDYVPFDDYVSRLHRGEMVLSASQARKYREGSKGQDFSGIGKMIVAAIREGMSDASVNAYVNGEGMTSMVNNNTANRLKSRRFAPA